jgi:hypothetical protein
MNETPSPYDVWAAEEALELVEEATAQRCTPSVGRCRSKRRLPATKPAPFVPTSDAFRPFVRHFSKSGRSHLGCPKKSNRIA